ncbi:hypothetical protein Ahy_A06g029929 [Arachis hypogaea]|uniref:Transmembrane protein n=1 Tax=Arachis hypogaea TaxID=3818 RepID=A0A445CUP1_ARAHY|nr:hypothetical protein Ahy_A06g029929 [Arachis hypogaea]
MQKTSITKEKESKQQQQQPKLLESDNRNLLFSLDRMKYPSFNVSTVMILILVFLTVFGRSVATLCTCVLWYVISFSKPIRKTVKNTNKKEYVKGLSEKKMVVMNEGLNSPSNDNGSPKYGSVAAASRCCSLRFGILGAILIIKETANYTIIEI